MSEYIVVADVWHRPITYRIAFRAAAEKYAREAPADYYVELAPEFHIRDKETGVMVPMENAFESYQLAKRYITNVLKRDEQ